MLAANTNSNTYLALLTGAFFGAVGLQTTVASAVTSLFGIYSAGRAYSLLRLFSRLVAVGVVSIPVYLNGWHTNMNMYWATAALMGIGLIASCFLNPYSLVQEPIYALERCNTSGNRNKYSQIHF